MTFKKFFEVRDADNKLRFATVFRIQAEFFVKKLLRRIKEGEKRPRICEVSR